MRWREILLENEDANNVVLVVVAQWVTDLDTVAQSMPTVRIFR